MERQNKKTNQRRPSVITESLFVFIYVLFVYIPIWNSINVLHIEEYRKYFFFFITILFLHYMFYFIEHKFGNRLLYIIEKRQLNRFACDNFGNKLSEGDLVTIYQYKNDKWETTETKIYKEQGFLVCDCEEGKKLIEFYYNNESIYLKKN
jgi:hypothetical protein